MLKPLDSPMYEYLYKVLENVRETRAAVQLKTTGELPDTYCIFYMVAGNPEGFFSGKESRENERYCVCVYDRDKAGMESAEPLVKSAMRDAGFLYISKSSDTYYKETGHWARSFDFRYYKEG